MMRITLIRESWDSKAPLQTAVVHHRLIDDFGAFGGFLQNHKVMNLSATTSSVFLRFSLQPRLGNIGFEAYPHGRDTASKEFPCSGA